MKTGHTLLVLAIAGLACAAVGVAVYVNNDDDFVVSQTSSDANDIVVTSHSVAPSFPMEVAMATRETEQASSEAPTEATVAPPKPEVNKEALRLGRQAFVKRDFQACIELLEPATEAGDLRFDVHYLLGLSQRYLGRYDDSEMSFDTALTIQPDNVRALVNSARTMIKQDRASEADARVQRALEIDQADADAWNVLGRVQLMQGQYEAAIDAFERCTEVDDTKAHAYNNKGFAHLQLGEWTLAVEALENAIALREDVAYFHNNLGVGQEQLGLFAQAAAAYAEAVRLDPQYEKALVSLARVTPLIDSVGVAAADSSASEDNSTVSSAAKSETETVAVSPQ